MSLVIRNSFTGTDGNPDYGDIIDIFNIDSRILNTEGGITNYYDYIKSILTKKGSIHKKYLPRKNRLDKLAQLLEKKYNEKVDPIHYLLFLYKQEELSVVGIQERFPNIFNGDIKSTYKFFQKLGWRMREGNEGTRITNAKRDTSAINEISINKSKKIQKDIQSTVKVIINNNTLDQTVYFEESYFHEIKTKKEKITYLLSVSLSISINSTLTLLSTLHQDYGYDALLKFVNNSLEQSNLGKHIEITRDNIRYILKK